MVEEDVVRMARKLEKIAAGQKSEDGAMDLIQNLSKMEVTLEVLQKTRIGMTVNEIRKKTSNDALASASKALIKAWKKQLDGAKGGSGKSSSNGAGKESSTPASTSEKPPPPAVTEDTVRAKCVDMLLASLNVGELPVGTLEPETLARRIEDKLYEVHKGRGPKYSSAVRSRVFNLRDKKNPELRENILTGVIAPERFATMTSEEMASPDVKEMRDKFTKEAIEEHQMSIQGGTATDMFKCGKCKKNNCTYNQVQTRSADEPMTTFVFCRECGNRWKFC